MARSNGNGPASGRGQYPTFGVNHFLSGEQFMLVVATNSDLQALITNMYAQIEYMLGARGGVALISYEEFAAYVVTAFKVRVEFVLRARWRQLGYQSTGMDVRDKWALPMPVHSVLSTIGTAQIGSQGTQILPLWDTGADALVLSREQRDLITPKLKAIAHLCEFPLAETISADADGVVKVMSMTYLPTQQVWLSMEAAGMEDAANHGFAGLTPVSAVQSNRGGAVYTIVDTEQLATALRGTLEMWIPPLSFAKQTVIRYMAELAEVRK
jgi:hypothetical protein